jgi:hypothetical protein
MKLQISLIFLLLISTVSNVPACLNEAEPMVPKQQIEVDGLSATDFYKQFVTHKDRAYWEKLRYTLDSRDRRNSASWNPNDLAVAMLHLGEVKEALKILEDWEKRTPGQYFTAANLGTAYELNGENRKALEWITEGVKRNKDSHFGTEWLHVKILEAKIAMEKEPDWLKSHSVLGVELPKGLPTDHLGQKKTLAETEDALVYQLHERLEFIKPPEPVVAQLLDDLSRVFAQTRTPEHSKAVKDLALSYSADSRAPTSTGGGEIVSVGGNPYFFYGLGAAVALLLIGAGYALIRKRQNRATIR